MRYTVHCSTCSEQIAELANRTKTQRLGDAISESEAKSDNLLVALQLDEAAKTKAIIKVLATTCL